ncbi:UNC93-like protein [Exophiala dermatitidis]
MSEGINNEKMATTSAGSAGTDTPPPEAVVGEDVKPRGKPWMYKRLKLGPITIPAYASPQFQIVFVALVCFLCPGMFNAVNGLGAAGQVSAHDINNANTALYSMFAGVGFFAGSIANRLGLRLTLGLGGVGYCIYIASILTYNHNQNAGFLIFAGALLGLCAGMLWCAQGAIMMAYPPERSKGRYIAVFWMIFNLGAVIGGLIPLAQNIHSKANSVNDGTYIAFIVLMAVGLILAGFLCNPLLVERSDGSRVILMKHPTWKSELLGLVETLTSDWYLLFLFPMFFASNWFYTYHFQDVNLARFTIRTRALNSVLYYLAQIVGAWVFGFALDTTYLRRSTRAKLAVVALFVLTFVIWGGGYDFQKQYTREEVSADDYVKLDWTSSGYVGPMFLYMFYGFYDSVWQTTAYWLMGSLTNNGRKLANFTGFYKGIQSAGGAISPVLDSHKVAYMTQFAINWGMLAGSLVVAAPVIWLKVKDTTDIDEDLKFSDETLVDVVPASAFVGPEGMMGEKIEAKVVR